MDNSIASNRVSTHDRLRSLNAQAWSVRRTDPDKARSLAENVVQSTRLLLQSQPSSTVCKHELATALLILASVDARTSGFAVALEQAGTALELFTEIGNSTGRLHALATLTKVYIVLCEYQKAAELIEAGMGLMDGVADPEARGVILSAQGQFCWATGNYPEALNCFLRSLAFVEQADNGREMFGLLNNISTVYTMLGDYDRGLEYSNSALLLTKQHGDKLGESAALLSMGILHRRQGDIDKAKEYFLQTLDICNNIGNRSGQMHALNNLASVEFDLGNYAQAEQYATEALRLARSTGERKIESFALVSLGQLCSRRGQYDKAMELYTESLALRRAAKDRYGEIDALVIMASTYAEMEYYGESLGNLFEALALAEELRGPAHVFEIYEQLATVYEQSGDTAQALSCHRKFYALQKEFFNEQAVIRQKSLQVFYETQQAAREAEIYRQKNEELAAANAEILRQKQDIEEYAETIRKAHDQLLDKSIALEHLNRDKDEFIGIAVHGLKNPLAHIIMSASMLRRNSHRMTKAELDKNLEWIEIAAWRMEDLVLKLLQSNAIETGGTDFAPELVDLSSLLLPIVQEYVRRATVKGIRIETAGIDDSLTAYVDASMTRDIVDNLISNAVKFSPRGTAICVRVFPDSGGTVAEEVSDRVCISVADEGPGISEEDRGRLFGKFERLTAQPTGGEHSTGLGLSIVKRLTEIMGGRIRCESTPGEGATFIVELPAAARVPHGTGVQQL